MTFNLAQADEDNDTFRTAALDRERGDRMRGDGRDLVIQSALKVIEVHEVKLTGNNKMKFAAAMAENTNNLISAFTANEERKECLPVQLPKALPTRKEGLRAFHAHGNSRKRAMTSLEMVQDDEKRAKREERKKKLVQDPKDRVAINLSDKDNDDNDVLFIGQSQRGTEGGLPARLPYYSPPPRSPSPPFLHLSGVISLSSSSSSSPSSEEELLGLLPTSSGRVRKPSKKVASQQRRELTARKQDKAKEKTRVERRERQEKTAEKRKRKEEDKTTRKLVR